MPYLNLDLDYFDHPKTRRLVCLLGEGAEMLPIKLWCHAGKFHASTGVLHGYSIKEIEGMAGWKGSEGSALEAMIKVGFIAEMPDGYALHEWLDHEGHLVMFKKRARRAARKRWGVSKHATSIAKRGPKQCPNHTIPTLPNQTIPNQPKGVGEIPPDLLPNEAEIKDWLDYKRQKGQGYKGKGLDALWRALRAIPPESRRASVDWSMANNWSGLFEKKGQDKPTQQSQTEKELERRRELSASADAIIAATQRNRPT